MTFFRRNDGRLHRIVICSRYGPAAQSARSLVDEQIDALVLSKVMETREKRMWQERISPRNEGERMHTLLKTKIGPFLVIPSVLALWMFLAVQHVQAHSLTDPSCGSLPNDDFFDLNDDGDLSNDNVVAELVLRRS